MSGKGFYLRVRKFLQMVENEAFVNKQNIYALLVTLFLIRLQIVISVCMF